MQCAASRSNPVHQPVDGCRLPAGAALRAVVERLPEARAVALANSFHAGLTARHTGLPRDIEISSGLFHVPKRVFEDTLLDQVNRWSCDVLECVAFRESRRAYSGLYRFNTADSLMVGYGVWEVKADGLFFRCQIFPRFRRQGYGDLALRLIASALQLEAPMTSSREVIFPRINSLPQHEFRERALLSGLPGFLQKRGFIPRGADADPASVDFVRPLAAGAMPVMAATLTDSVLLGMPCCPAPDWYSPRQFLAGYGMRRMAQRGSSAQCAGSA